MKILLTGARGMLGSALLGELGAFHDVVGLGREQLDITDLKQCSRQVSEADPDVVINAAAVTDVDRCETQQEKAFRVNAQGAGNLAQAARAGRAVLVYFSTDYVFDGAKSGPYHEEDAPNPQSVYGKSKLKGEELVQSVSPEYLILRTSWVFGCNGKNFIRTIVARAVEGQELRVVADQRGSPSYARDLAAHTRLMLEAGSRGTYHLTNSGSCTWYDLARQAIAWAGLSARVIPVTTAEFPRPACRPANSVLANARLEREGFPRMRPWREAGQEYVKTYLRLTIDD